MIGHKNQRKAAGPITQLLGVDHVDMREYHGHIGDLIRIDAFSLFKLDKVLAAIRAEKAGVIERGLARLDPTANQCLYTATAENPEKDDWSIAVTAVRAPKPVRTRFRCGPQPSERPGRPERSFQDRHRADAILPDEDEQIARG